MRFFLQANKRYLEQAGPELQGGPQHMGGPPALVQWLPVMQPSGQVYTLARSSADVRDPLQERAQDAVCTQNPEPSEPVICNDTPALLGC